MTKIARRRHRLQHPPSRVTQLDPERIGFMNQRCALQPRRIPVDLRTPRMPLIMLLPWLFERKGS